MPKGTGGYSGMSSKSRWSGSVDSAYRRKKKRYGGPSKASPSKLKHIAKVKAARNKAMRKY